MNTYSSLLLRVYSIIIPETGEGRVSVTKTKKNGYLLKNSYEGRMEYFNDGIGRFMLEDDRLVPTGNNHRFNGRVIDNVIRSLSPSSYKRKSFSQPPEKGRIYLFDQGFVDQALRGDILQYASARKFNPEIIDPNVAGWGMTIADNASTSKYLKQRHTTISI